MDHRRYPELMERYKELGTLSIDPHETRESLIKKLTDISREKKKIMVEANAIISEYITKYENSPEPPDSEAAAMLEDFLSRLRPSNQELLDPPLSLRISRLLLRYYQSTNDPEQILPILQQCALYDLTLKNHQDSYESSPYALMAEQYMSEFDRLSDKAKHTMIHCMVIGGYNRKDLTYGLKKFRENREVFVNIRKKMGEDDFTCRYYDVLFKSNALAYALCACLEAEDTENHGVRLSEPLIDLEKEAALMDEFKQELEDILASEQAQQLIYDRVSARFYIAQTDYHLGRITLDKLLSLMEEYLGPHEDYTPYEQSSALLTGWPCYLDYLCRCGSFDSQYVENRSIEIIRHVLTHAEETVKDLSQYVSESAINSAVLQMLCTSSHFLEFDFFKRTVLKAAVYANKELYVHTMMVKEICLVILDYILDNDPRYLDGVAGFDWEYCRDHKQELMELMENCALLHDIGKYFCLDIVNNSSRSLTDDEFEIIKEHPVNFSKVYQGSINPKIWCIRDCAELHHLWYNGMGGYPRKEHTVNKPLVNILTVADCIDAATDNIGRPYGLGKTTEQVIAEIDSERDTRYSGYISELLHVEEIRRRIDHVISDRRRDIYCEIYLKDN